MTYAQQQTALSVLEQQRTERLVRARQRRDQADRTQDESMTEWAVLLETEADALAATIALVSHYTPADKPAETAAVAEVET